MSVHWAENIAVRQPADACCRGTCKHLLFDCKSRPVPGRKPSCCGTLQKTVLCTRAVLDYLFSA